MEFYMQFWVRYFDFNGRTRRRDFWLASLVNQIIVTSLWGFSFIISSIFYAQLLFIIASFIPSFAIAVRRLHDTGKSGLWLFLLLVPVVGGIALLILWCIDSQEGSNAYGANPKEVSASRSVIENTETKSTLTNYVQKARESLPSTKKSNDFRPQPQEEDIFAKLERLAALKERGILTEEEFSEQKARILSR